MSKPKVFPKGRLGHEELEAVTKVLQSAQLSPFFRNFLGGDYLQRFEKAFANYHGVKHAIAVSSGTAALHTALLATGIGRGHTVITTPLSFVATASSILMCGANPHFIDVDPSTYNLNPKEIGSIFTYGIVPSAIIPVHLLGHPCDMDPLMEIAEQRNLIVIEDSAQACGAKYKGRLVGTIGHVGIFSFQHTKTITTGGEGGMIITNDDELAKRCRAIRNHGEKYAQTHYLGFNYRLTEMQAAFGIEQLKKLDALNDLQISNAKHLIENLPDEITPPHIADYATKHVFSLIGCQYEGDRDRFIEALTKKGIVQGKPGQNVSKGYTELIYNLPLFQPYRRRCPVAEGLIQKFLWFDLHRWNKTLKDMENYCQIFRECLK